MKKIWMVLFLIIVVAAIYVFGAYQVVKGKDSVTFRKKKEFSFDEFVVEPTQAEKVVDFIKDKVNEVDWARVRKGLENQWEEMARGIDELADEPKLKEMSTDLEREVAELKQDAVERYDQLVARLDEGDLSAESFEKKLRELLEWLEKKLDKLRAKFEG